jgi:diacylglycerol kinase family enzyme
MAACNGVYFGGGLKVSPESRLDDGYLNVIKIARPTSSVTVAVLRLKKGKHLRYDFVQNILAKQVKIESDKPLRIQADGEITSEVPFRAEVVSGALKIFK